MNKKEYYLIIQRTRFYKGKFCVYGHWYGEDPDQEDCIYLMEPDGQLKESKILAYRIDAEHDGWREVRLQLEDTQHLPVSTVVLFQDEEIHKIGKRPQINSYLKAWIYEMNNQESHVENAIVYLGKALWHAYFLTPILCKKEEKQDQSPIVEIEGVNYYVVFTDVAEMNAWKKQTDFGDGIARFCFRDFWRNQASKNSGLLINPANQYGSALLNPQLVDQFAEMFGEEVVAKVE